MGINWSTQIKLELPIKPGTTWNMVVGTDIFPKGATESRAKYLSENHILSNEEEIKDKINEAKQKARDRYRTTYKNPPEFLLFYLQEYNGNYFKTIKKIALEYYGFQELKPKYWKNKLRSREKLSKRLQRGTFK